MSDKWTLGAIAGRLRAIVQPNQPTEAVRLAADKEASEQGYVHAGRDEFIRGFITGYTRQRQAVRGKQ